MLDSDGRVGVGTMINVGKVSVFMVIMTILCNLAILVVIWSLFVQAFLSYINCMEICRKTLSKDNEYRKAF